MNDDLDSVLYLKKEDTAQVILSRPEKLNAINDRMFSSIEIALADAEEDPNVKVIVIKGAGKAFTSGQDLSSGGGTSEVMMPDPYEKPYVREVLHLTQRMYHRWMKIFDH